MRSETEPFQGTWIQNMACSILKCGQMPKHVGFIMDGNRRFAERSRISRADGHQQGLASLTEVLSWCRALGIEQITVYAFSIENFKRSREEVDNLMNLAKNKCDSMIEELNQLNEAGIRIRFVGDLDLLPQALREKMEKVHQSTRNNNKSCLNICFAYTSRHELVAAIKKLSDKVHAKKLEPDDIGLEVLDKEMYLPPPFPDMIIRTSGEVRLSDFMLWQCQTSSLIFIDALWPEITFWDLMKAIFLHQYQRRFQRRF